MSCVTSLVLLRHSCLSCNWRLGERGRGARQKSGLYRRARLIPALPSAVTLCLPLSPIKSPSTQDRNSKTKTQALQITIMSAGAKSVISNDMQELGHGKEDTSNKASGLKAAISNPSEHLHLLFRPSSSRRTIILITPLVTAYEDSKTRN